MKVIILGFCDYLKDWWRDIGGYPYSPRQKEGNLWHYIRQRRIAKRVKKIRKS